MRRREKRATEEKSFCIEKYQRINFKRTEKITTRELCKLLNIRQTLYNNRLNEFIAEVYSRNFLSSGALNYLEIKIFKTKSVYKVSIYQSNLVFAKADEYEFKDKFEVREFIRDFKNKNEFRIIVSDLI